MANTSKNGRSYLRNSNIGVNYFTINLLMMSGKKLHKSILKSEIYIQNKCSWHSILNDYLVFVCFPFYIIYFQIIMWTEYLVYQFSSLWLCTDNTRRPDVHLYYKRQAFVFVMPELRIVPHFIYNLPSCTS